jgi:hypothetical protein
LCADRGFIPALDEVPERLRGGFGLLDPSEVERRITIVRATCTRRGSVASLCMFLDLWSEIEYFVRRVSPHYNHSDTRVLLATADHEQLNARTFPHPPSNVRVVMFYERMFDFVKDLGCILPVAYATSESRADNLEDFPAIITKASECPLVPSVPLESLLRSFFGRHYRQDPKLDFSKSKALPEPIRLLGQDMELAMTSFVVGHEIAHILVNHSDNERLWNCLEARPTTDGAAQFPEVLRNWDDEHEADFVGFKLGQGVAALYQIPFEIYAWSVGLFFSANQWLADRRGWTFERIDLLSPAERFRIFETHPPLHRRYQLIKEMAEDIAVNNAGGGDGSSFSMDPIERLNEFVKGSPSLWT